MKNDIDPNRLDSIIESALSGYTGAEPLAGIERRVLNRISAAHALRRRSKILAWALACPILIAAPFLAIAVWTPAVTQAPPINVGSLPHVTLPSNALVIEKPAVARNRQPIARKRLETRVSGEERTLLALVQSHPAEIQSIFAAMQQHKDTPVEIEEIQIAPLQITEVQ